MGNDISQANSKLGITSLSVTTPNIEMPQYQKFVALCSKIAEEKQSDMITREEMMGVLKQQEKFAPPDTELFIQLFTLFDFEGHDTVDYKNYLAGSAVCLLSNSNVERLKFAYSIYDTKNTGYSLRSDTKKLLLAVNHTASFFGDPVLTPNEIEMTTIGIFNEMKNQTLQGAPIDDLVNAILQHPMIWKFMTGEGTVRFGSPEMNV